MTPSLRMRLVAGQVAIVVASLALMTVFAVREQRGWVADRVGESLARAAARIADELPAAADWEAVAARFGAAFGYRVTLIDRAGRVLGDSEVRAARLAGVENHAARPEVRAALGGANGRAVRRSRTTGVELVYVAVPAPAGRGVAVVRLAEPLLEVRTLGASLVRLSLMAALLAMLLSVPLALWLASRQSARILELESVSRRIGAGDAEVRAREGPPDELGRLGRAINQMAAESRRRLEALERERDERERILSHLGDGVALVDGRGRVIRMNRSCAELLRAPLPAEPGTPFVEFARAPELDGLIRRTREANATQEAELRLSAQEERTLHAVATPLPGSGAGAVLLVLHDLTEAERLQRVRQDLVANVSHELRTPLTSLRGYAETLLDGGLEDVEHREQFVRVIRDQAVRLEAISEDLLTLARLERPGARPEVEALDLRELVARQVASFRTRAAAAGLELALDPGEPLPVRADRHLLEQLVSNLLDNALKYTERGRVRLRLGAEDARVWGEVEDTGCGIPEADQSRVFERFYRVDKARSREKGGTGLGLSIVKHVATLHGGEVSVRSRLGEGSTFRFELPREPLEP